MISLDEGVTTRIAAIATKSTPMWERTVDPIHRPGSVDRHRLERWQAVLGSGPNLLRRLKNAGLADHPLQCLQRQAPETAVHQAWIEALRDVIETTASLHRAGSVDDAVFDSAAPIPFEEALIGFVSVGRRLLQAQAGDALLVLSPRARLEIERHLLSHLAFVASLPIGQEFYAFRFDRAPASAIAIPWAEQARTTEIYLSFIASLCSDGLLAFFEKYPVLARLLCRSVLNWSESMGELCERIQEDLPLFEALGAADLSPTAVVSGMSPGRSDRHERGRTVVILTLINGVRLVYKPRSLKPEQAFYRLVELVNKDLVPPDPLASVGIIERGTHGWMAYVDTYECEGKERARFNRRAGMVLCLLRTLAVSDIHYENLLRSGGQPVVVDLEMILDIKPEPSDTTTMGASSAGSVLDTGMLPRSLSATEPNLNAIGPRWSGSDIVRRPIWLHVNTDQMTLIDSQQEQADEADKVTPDPYRDDFQVREVLGGFTWMYRALLRGREHVAGDALLLSLLNALEPRVLVRNTSTYATLHLHLLHPEFLHNGLDRSIELEWLARPLSAPNLADPKMVDVFHEEVESMEELDIPRFVGAQSMDTDTHGASEFDELFRRTRDSSTFLRNVANLNLEDLQRQQSLIHASLTGK